MCVMCEVHNVNNNVCHSEGVVVSCTYTVANTLLMGICDKVECLRNTSSIKCY